jgi:hypothetical protein
MVVPIITEEEQNYWEAVPLSSAIMDVLGSGAYDKLVDLKVPQFKILEFVLLHCMIHPEELGVRRHRARLKRVFDFLKNSAG